MGPTQKILWSIYIGAIGTASTIAAQQAVKLAWKAATGKQPPAPNDPDVPASEAASWVAASAVGVAVAQMAASRFAARRWQLNMGTEQPSNPKVKFNV